MDGTIFHSCIFSSSLSQRYQLLYQRRPPLGACPTALYMQVRYSVTPRHPTGFLGEHLVGSYTSQFQNQERSHGLHTYLILTHAN
jgi:hypothetical protein